MKRLVGIGRSRAGRLGLIAGIVVAALGGLSAPAYAHHAIVSGSTVCANNDHVITWSIGNSENDKLMNIDSITATANGQSYAVTGYTSSVGNGGTTTATTIVPGPVTNTSVVLTVNASWPFDNAKYTATASVPLQGTCGCGCTSTTTAPSSTTEPTTTTTAHDNRCDANHPGNGSDDPQGHGQTCETTTTLPVTTTTEHHCECNTTTTAPVTTTTEHHCGCSTTTTEATTTTTEPTTTTTEATTTTTEDTTTTTMPTTTSTQAEGTTTIVTTTTLGHQGSTVPTTQPPAPTTTQAPPVQGELPFTGSGIAFPVIFGLGSLILGGVFAFRKRNAWTR